MAAAAAAAQSDARFPRASRSDAAGATICAPCLGSHWVVSRGLRESFHRPGLGHVCTSICCHPSVRWLCMWDCWGSARDRSVVSDLGRVVLGLVYGISARVDLFCFYLPHVFSIFSRVRTPQLAIALRRRSRHPFLEEVRSSLDLFRFVT